MRVRRIAGRAGLGALLVLSVPFGLFVVGAVLLVVVAASGIRVPATTAAVVAVVACAGGAARLAAGRLSARRRPHRRTAAVAAGVSLVLLGGALWVAVWAPAPKYPTATMPVPTRYWNLPTGSRIAYWPAPAHGTPRRTPVILVDGGPGAPYGPQPAITATLTRAGFDVYAYHQVGSGLSGRLADIRKYTVARHVADLDAIRAAIGARRVDLVGVSWGGQLIANYLAAHPGRAARVVVASPAPIWSPAFPGSADLTADGARDQDAALAHHPRFAIAHVLLGAVGPGTTHALLPDDQVDGEFQAFVGGLDMRAGCGPGHRPYRRPAGDGSRFGFWVNAMTTRDADHVADPRPVLRHVTTPVLVMRAQCDYLAWPVTREYRDLLPHATMIAVGGSGHEIPTERPALYDTAVRDFLLNARLPQRPYTAAMPPWRSAG